MLLNFSNSYYAVLNYPKSMYSLAKFNIKSQYLYEFSNFASLKIALCKSCLFVLRPKILFSISSVSSFGVGNSLSNNSANSLIAS